MAGILLDVLACRLQSVILEFAEFRRNVRYLSRASAFQKSIPKTFKYFRRWWKNRKKTAVTCYISLVRFCSNLRGFASENSWISRWECGNSQQLAI